MFSDSLLDYSSGRSRRGWSTLLAWIAQMLLVAVAVVLPLWNISALPRLTTYLPVAGPPPGEPPKSAAPERQPAGERTHSADAIVANAFVQPARIPRGVNRTAGPPTELADVAPCDICVPGSVGSGDPRTASILRSILPPVTATPALPKPVSRVAVSGGVSQGYLLHEVRPVYPAIARAARVQGTVVLAAVISREGAIEGLHLVSGPPMLVNAAMDAVRQWRYRPYLLNGQPVEVETQITVVFTLGAP